jgi:hypothetical protein
MKKSKRPTAGASSAPRAGSATITDVLERLADEFEKQSEFWRTVTDDPHGIATAVMASMTACENAVRKTMSSLPNNAYPTAGSHNKETK